MSESRNDTSTLRKRHSNPFLKFSDEGVIQAARRWAADQRERQAWRDEDMTTYRYRAELLEALIKVAEK